MPDLSPDKTQRVGHTLVGPLPAMRTGVVRTRFLWSWSCRAGPCLCSQLCVRWLCHGFIRHSIDIDNICGRGRSGYAWSGPGYGQLRIDELRRRRQEKRRDRDARGPARPAPPACAVLAVHRPLAPRLSLATLPFRARPQGLTKTDAETLHKLQAEFKIKSAHTRAGGQFIWAGPRSELAPLPGPTPFTWISRTGPLGGNCSGTVRARSTRGRGCSERMPEHRNVGGRNWTPTRTLRPGPHGTCCAQAQRAGEAHLQRGLREQSVRANGAYSIRAVQWSAIARRSRSRDWIVVLNRR